MDKSKLPRGIRNNNPLNIRKGKVKWMGEVLYLEGVPVERDFCQFESMVYGWRAAFILLRKYIKTYKCNTVRKIISRWAPENENYTETYIKYVASKVAEGADGEISPDSEPPALLLIAAAMCEMENGVNYTPFALSSSLSDFIEGKKLADSYPL